MNSPSYLWRNKFGTYFFRARIPLQLCQHFKKSEIKKSLQTDSLRLAVKLARAYRVELDKELDKLKQGVYLAEERTLEGNRRLTMPDGEEKTIEGKIALNLDEDSKPHREYLLNQLREEAKHELDEAREKILFEARLAAIEANSAPNQRQIPPEPAPLLSELIKIYFEEGETLKRWKNRTLDQIKATLSLFQSIVGDIPIKSIDKAITRDFKQKYLKLPANMNKKAAYRDKTILELLAMDIPEQDRLAHNTINNNIIRVSVLFGWAVNQGYIDKNPLEGLTLGKKKRAADERQAFDKDDLIRLFDSKEYRKGFKHPYQYWMPIIALYTGMRLEEMCRLQIYNFKLVDGIDCIALGKDGEWDGKTVAALRYIPLHPKLHELGLLDYVGQIKANGNTRLFAEINPVKGEYGASVSKWFTRYRIRCGIVDSGKVFHSFRHTLANEFKQNSVPLEVAEAIIGHESESMTYGRYGKDYRVGVMFDAIKLVDFGISYQGYLNRQQINEVR
ncbi:DUF6538 domain-containing protein [Methylovulum miyakonense]|uniref:DUF6538 domain-containing protein n=1 Tax=Methylovulum miyakonense TaxID=645578 RepID=UPI00038276BF